MPTSLVRTKLYIPRVRASLVARPRLGERLSGTSRPRLTLVSAPPGFGKTTLLAAWIDGATSERPVAWVSLEESEREQASFWTYVATAIDGAAPGVGAGALEMLLSGTAPMQSVLASVVNGLGGLPTGLDLVLDDYHLADGPAIADDMAFLLEHLPPDVQVVISTRADPALPLARMRARGELVEIRAADLRFTLAEVAAYLNEVAGLGLQSDDVAALEGRTEGWIAALQLAALSLQGRDDAAGFIAGFAGDDRYVVDYLVEEVLGRQPEEVRSFLLATSILDRLNAALCDAVTQRTDGSTVLDLLDRSNLFLVPLDDNRQWYRYHHLFAEVLRTHLLQELPREVTSLHRRASEWYEGAGEVEAAVRHALAAGEADRAADLVERVALGLLRDRREGLVRQWLDDLPDAVVAARPVLAVGFIGALMSSGEFGTVERRIDDLERLLAAAEADPAVELSVVDRSELARLPGAIEMYRAGLALVAGDQAAVAVHADRAIARAAQGDDLTVSAAAALSGLASWSSGDLAEAHRRYTIAVEGLRRAGHFPDVLGCSITLADIRITQGRLRDARRTYEDALQLAATESPGTVMRGTADMLVGLSQVAFEHDDLEAAQDHLDRAEELGEQFGLPQHPYRRRVARARLLEATGDLVAAVAQLEEAERVYVGDFSPDVRPVPAMRARVLAAHGRLADALEWVRNTQLSTDDELSYVREYEHVTLARILLADASHAEPGTTYRFLERLLAAAEAGGRTGTAIEILVLQACDVFAEHGSRGLAPALVPLERALRLAEPEGPVRVFVDEGPRMARLLEALTRKHPSWRFARTVLEACEPSAATPTVGTSPDLVEQLSARELDVLRLLATDLDGPAVARELVVSLNTVRTHTKSIYAKLGVNSRRAAVSRARELDLLGRSSRR